MIQTTVALKKYIKNTKSKFILFRFNKILINNNNLRSFFLDDRYFLKFEIYIKAVLVLILNIIF